MNKLQKKSELDVQAYLNPKKAAADLAKKMCVKLASSATTPAPTAAAAKPATKGWLAAAMPEAALVMVQLKESLGPLYADVLANLKNGKGFLVDETTNIAIGNPPAEWQRGKIEDRDGFKIMRVRRRAAD